MQRSPEFVQPETSRKSNRRNQIKDMQLQHASHHVPQTLPKNINISLKLQILTNHISIVIRCCQWIIKYIRRFCSLQRKEWAFIQVTKCSQGETSAFAQKHLSVKLFNVANYSSDFFFHPLRTSLEVLESFAIFYRNKKLFVQVTSFRKEAIQMRKQNQNQ